MAQQTFVKFFEDHYEGFTFCVSKNKVNKEDIFAILPGPEDNWAVVDLKTAIELEMGYTIATSLLHYTGERS